MFTGIKKSDHNASDKLKFISSMERCGKGLYVELSASVTMHISQVHINFITERSTRCLWSGDKVLPQKLHISISWTGVDVAIFRSFDIKEADTMGFQVLRFTFKVSR
jgi:hypothetical protein